MDNGELGISPKPFMKVSPLNIKIQESNSFEVGDLVGGS